MMKTLKQFIAEANVPAANIHPHRDEWGDEVHIDAPHAPTHESTWHDSKKHATATPGSAVPSHIHGISTDKWTPPKHEHEWQHVEGQDHTIKEPAFGHASKRLATGVIIHEKDRVWMVHPTNAFGGYESTMPKGKLEHGLHPQANAIKEAHEESGLKVRITGHAGDFERSTSYTRYYHAERVSGNPSHMGWESQAVSLVPKSEVHKHLTAPADKPIAELIQKHGKD